MKAAKLLITLLALACMAQGVPACAITDIGCMLEQRAVGNSLSFLGIQNIGTEEAPQYAIEGGTLGTLRDKITWNPDISDYPVLLNMINAFLMLVGPFFALALMWLGFKYMTMGDNPAGRSQSISAIKRLFVGMIAVLFSRQIFDLFLDVSTALASMVMSVNPSITLLAEAIMVTRTTSFLFAVFVVLTTILALLVVAIRYLLVLVLAVFFPLILACYFIDIDFIRGLGRFGMNAVVGVMTMQFIMAALFSVSLIAASSLDVSDPIGSVMALFICCGGFIGMALAPLGALGVHKVVGGAVGVAGAGAVVVGAATGQPELVAAGSVAAAGGSVVKGSTDLTGAGLATAKTVEHYRRSGGSGGKSRVREETLQDAVTPKLWSNMDKKVDGRSIQSYGEQAAFAELAEAEASGRPYNVGDAGYGRMLAKGMMARGFNGPSREYNDMDPKMTGYWSDGSGDLPGHLGREWIPHWQKHGAIEVREDGGIHVTEKGMEVVKKHGYQANPVSDSRKRTVRPSTESNFRPAADSIIEDENDSLRWFRYSEGDLDVLPKDGVESLEKRFPALEGGRRPVIVPNVREMSSPGAHRLWGPYTPPNPTESDIRALERVRKDFREGRWNPGASTPDFLAEQGIDRETLSAGDAAYYRMREQQEAYYKGISGERATLNREVTPTKAALGGSLPSGPDAVPLELRGDTVMADRVLASSIDRLKDGNAIVLDNPVTIEGQSTAGSGEVLDTTVYAEDLGTETCFVSVNDNRTTTYVTPSTHNPIETVKRESEKGTDLNKILDGMSTRTRQDSKED